MYTQRFLHLGKTYRHYKGGMYEVQSLAFHTERENEELVIYHEVGGDGTAWARPMDMFLSEAPSNERNQKWRFELMEEAKN